MNDLDIKSIVYNGAVIMVSIPQCLSKMKFSYSISSLPSDSVGAVAINQIFECHDIPTETRVRCRTKLECFTDCDNWFPCQNILYAQKIWHPCTVNP